MTYIDILAQMGLFIVTGMGAVIVILSLIAYWVILGEGTINRKKLEAGSVLDPLGHPSKTFEEIEDLKYIHDEYDGQVNALDVWKELALSNKI